MSARQRRAYARRKRRTRLERCEMAIAHQQPLCPCPKCRPERIAAAARLRAERCTLRQIGDALGVSYETVRLWLLEAQ